MLGALALIGVVTLLVVSAAPASSSQPTLSARPFPAMLGMIPAARAPSTEPNRPAANDLAGPSFTSADNLIYHGGRVLHTNQAFAIFWGSTHTSAYRGLISGFLKNVAADSGKTTNVYATSTQYYDTFGPVTYTTTYGGSYVDTTSSIPDHCSSQYARTGITVTGCVTDADIQAEVSHAITAAGWTTGPNKVFFVFTPRNVGSCYDSSSAICSYSAYCAYHSFFVDSHLAVVLYANHPYTDTAGVGAPGVCDSGEHPNNDWADATINVVSHEHNEAITDPDGSAWYDSSGNENGDKCAWTFGTPLGSTSFGAYNQAIATGTYYLQREWSNATSSCELTYGVAAPGLTDFSPRRGSPGDSVTIRGTNFTGATAVAFNGTPASFSVTSPGSIIATVPAGAGRGPISVTTPGGTATSSASFKASGGPAPTTIATFSPGKGRPGATVSITGTSFTGATVVDFGGVVAGFTVNSSTSITATVPVGATKGHIRVIAPNGTAISVGSFKVK